MKAKGSRLDVINKEAGAVDDLGHGSMLIACWENVPLNLGLFCFTSIQDSGNKNDSYARGINPMGIFSYILIYAGSRNIYMHLLVIEA